ncbi:hypothetical protein BDW22DRAFT_1416084 [Trametopsis cervina]|nr:hypothetical protein BDW22DRAFT_1416084 [Trametopsis cervina]
MASFTMCSFGDKVAHAFGAYVLHTNKRCSEHGVLYGARLVGGTDVFYDVERRVSVFSARADARTNQLSSAGLSRWMETARMDIDVRVSRFRGMWNGEGRYRNAEDSHPSRDVGERPQRPMTSAEAVRIETRSPRPGSGLAKRLRCSVKATAATAEESLGPNKSPRAIVLRSTPICALNHVVRSTVAAAALALLALTSTVPWGTVSTPSLRRLRTHLPAIDRSAFDRSTLSAFSQKKVLACAAITSRETQKAWEGASSFLDAGQRQRRTELIRRVSVRRRGNCN